MKIYRVFISIIILLTIQACDTIKKDPCTSCGGHAKSCQLMLQETQSRTEIAVKAYKLQHQCGMSEDMLLLALDGFDKDID